MSDFAAELLAAAQPKNSELLTPAQSDAARRFQQRQELASAVLAVGQLAAEVFRPLLDEFQKVLERTERTERTEGINALMRGRVRLESPGIDRPDAGTARVSYRATGTAPGRHVFTILLRARLAAAGTVELAAQCSRDLPPSYTRDPAPQPLVELPASSLPLAALDREAARSWCMAVLKQCAAAIREANFGPTDAPVHAPLAAVPIGSMAAGVFST